MGNSMKSIVPAKYVFTTMAILLYSAFKILMFVSGNF